MAEYDFSIVKKGYDKEAVDLYIKGLEEKSAEKIRELTDKLAEKEALCDKLLEENRALNQDKARVADVIMLAEKNAEEIKKKALEEIEQKNISIEAEIEKRKRIVVELNEQIRKMRIDNEKLLIELREQFVAFSQEIKASTDEMVNGICDNINESMEATGRTTDKMIASEK